MTVPKAIVRGRDVEASGVTMQMRGRLRRKSHSSGTSLEIRPDKCQSCFTNLKLNTETPLKFYNICYYSL